MRYEIAVDGRVREVEVLRLRDGRFKARVDGREWTGDFIPGHLVLEGSSFEYAADREPSGRPRQVVVRGRAHAVTVLGMGFRRSAGGPGPGEVSSGTVTAPMNGQVVKILAGEGSAVEAGQVVLVLEAMKMENEVTAPGPGRVRRLVVTSGQAVHPGQLLFEVEPPEGAD